VSDGIHGSITKDNRTMPIGFKINPNVKLCRGHMVQVLHSRWRKSHENSLPVKGLKII